MAKRIQMRKNRFLALQKMAEQKKNEAMTNAANAVVDVLGDMLPKQTIVNMGQGTMDHPKAGDLFLDTFLQVNNWSSNITF